MLHAQGRPGDRRRAGELLEQAGAVAGRLGMDGLKAHIASLQDTLAASPEPIPADAAVTLPSWLALDGTSDAPTVPSATAAEPSGHIEPTAPPATPMPSVTSQTPASPDREAPQTPAPSPAASGDRFQREGELWTISFDGKLVLMKDSKGLRQIALLLAKPGQELHATDLEALVGGPAEAPAATPSNRVAHGELELRADSGDAGALLDAEAKAAYKARLDELQEEIDEAEDFNDPVRAERAREERDFLIRELARAVGLGGRDRKASSHAERARLNATRAIRSAMTHLTREHPALGQHLAATIRTGRYCSYTPDPRSPVNWQL
jgi:hypothetical protein